MYCNVCGVDATESPSSEMNATDSIVFVFVFVVVFFLFPQTNQFRLSQMNRRVTRTCQKQKS